MRNSRARLCVSSFLNVTCDIFDQAFGKVLCLLGRNPQYIKLLREEVDRVVHGFGWTKDAVAKMRKIDSFIKEALRFEGSSTSMHFPGPLLPPSLYFLAAAVRKAREDVTLSDGTFIPRGTTIAFAEYAIEHDEQNYENPNEFEPSRYLDLQDKSGDPAKYQLTSVTNDFLVFGMGEVAWYVPVSRLCGSSHLIFSLVQAGLWPPWY